VSYFVRQADSAVDPADIEPARVSEAESFTFIDVERGDPDEQDWDLFAEPLDGVL
jgi:hypothetical protein